MNGTEQLKQLQKAGMMRKVRITARARDNEQKVYPISQVHPMGDNPDPKNAGEYLNVPILPPLPSIAVVCGVPTEVEVSPRMLQDLKLDGVLAIEEMK